MGNSCTIKVRVSTSDNLVDLVSLDKKDLIWYPPDFRHPFIIDKPIDITITRIVKKPPLYKAKETQWSESCIIANKNNLHVNMGVGGNLAYADFAINPNGQTYLVTVTLLRNLQ